MKKAFILFFLSLFTYGAIYADVTWKLSDDGILTISGTKMDDYQYNDAPWSFQSGKIEKVVIEEGVTNIGNDAFSDCRSLTSVTIPNTVVKIGNAAFIGCVNLVSITIPNSVTSIGASAFSYCQSLASITIPKSVTNIEPGIASNCPNLISITVEEGNKNYDSRNNCNAIIETETNNLILGCKNTVIPNSVKRIEESAFWGCSELTSIEIPNSVTSIGEWAFAWCSSLSSVTIPNSITSIEKALFMGCTSLSKVNCYATTPPSVGENSFMRVPFEDGILYVPASSVSAYQNASGWNEWINVLPIEENAPTSVDNIVNGQRFDDKMYNLNGQRIVRYDTHKGIYIRNGKKYAR